MCIRHVGTSAAICARTTGQPLLCNMYVEVMIWEVVACVAVCTESCGCGL